MKESLSKQGKTWQPSRVDRRSRDSSEGYAAERLVHELLITEFMLAVWQTVEQRPDMELLTVQRRSLAKHRSFAVKIGSRQTRVIPDAMFTFRHTSQGMCCCFLELDNGTMNAKQIQAKFARYTAWSKSVLGQQYLIDLYKKCGAKDPRATFRLLMVVRSRTGLNDDGRLKEILTAANRAPAGLCKRIWLTTVAALREHQENNLPLDATIWLRSGDVASLAESNAIMTRIGHHSLFPPVVPDCDAAKA